MISFVQATYNSFRIADLLRSQPRGDFWCLTWYLRPPPRSCRTFSHRFCSFARPRRCWFAVYSSLGWLAWTFVSQKAMCAAYPKWLVWMLFSFSRWGVSAEILTKWKEGHTHAPPTPSAAFFYRWMPHTKIRRSTNQNKTDAGKSQAFARFPAGAPAQRSEERWPLLFPKQAAFHSTLDPFPLPPQPLNQAKKRAFNRREKIPDTRDYQIACLLNRRPPMTLSLFGKRSGKTKKTRTRGTVSLPSNSVTSQQKHNFGPAHKVKAFHFETHLRPKPLFFAPFHISIQHFGPKSMGNLDQSNLFNVTR